MPVKREVRRLGGRWPAIVERVASFVEAMPPGGMPLAAFGEAVLADVSPLDVGGIVKALESKGVVWVRRGGGAALVYGKRPSSIAGVLGGPDPAEICLSECAKHLCAVTNAIAQRDHAKAAGDFHSASAAREWIEVASTRLVKVIRKHVDRGLSLDAFREALWRNWVPGTLETVALFEPAIALGSKADLSCAEPQPRRRIKAGLSPIDKIAALVAKAGNQGMTKTDLRRAIKPKLTGDELGELLDCLADEGRIEPREVRIEVTGKLGVRYFAREAWRAA